MNLVDFVEEKQKTWKVNFDGPSEGIEIIGSEIMCDFVIWL